MSRAHRHYRHYHHNRHRHDRHATTVTAVTAATAAAIAVPVGVRLKRHEDALWVGLVQTEATEGTTQGIFHWINEGCLPDAPTSSGTNGTGAQRRHSRGSRPFPFPPHKFMRARDSLSRASLRHLPAPPSEYQMTAQPPPTTYHQPNPHPTRPHPIPGEDDYTKAYEFWQSDDLWAAGQPDDVCGGEDCAGISPVTVTDDASFCDQSVCLEKGVPDEDCCGNWDKTGCAPGFTKVCGWGVYCQALRRLQNSPSVSMFRRSQCTSQ